MRLFEFFGIRPAGDRGYSIRTENQVPLVIVHYSEAGGSHDFEGELATRSVILSIYVPRAEEWDQRLPWAAGRRSEIIERVARHVSRRAGWGSKFVVHPGRVDILKSRWF